MVLDVDLNDCVGTNPTHLQVPPSELQGNDKSHVCLNRHEFLVNRRPVFAEEEAPDSGTVSVKKETVPSLQKQAEEPSNLEVWLQRAAEEDAVISQKLAAVKEAIADEKRKSLQASIKTWESENRKAKAEARKAVIAEMEAAAAEKEADAAEAAFGMRKQKQPPAVTVEDLNASICPASRRFNSWDPSSFGRGLTIVRSPVKARRCERAPDPPIYVPESSKRRRSVRAKMVAISAVPE